MLSLAIGSGACAVAAGRAWGIRMVLHTGYFCTDACVVRMQHTECAREEGGRCADELAAVLGVVVWGVHGLRVTG